MTIKFRKFKGHVDLALVGRKKKYRGRNEFFYLEE